MTIENLSYPELGLIAGTRGMLGMGIGLLVAERLKPEQRRAVGWTLVAVGVLTTIPLAADLLLTHRRRGSSNGRVTSGAREEEVAGAGI